MRRIEIDETQPNAASVGQTLLRIAIGIIAVGHGVEKLIHLRTFQGVLIQHSVPSPETVAMFVVGLELVAGVCLIFGRFTRTAAFALLCDAIAAATLLWLNQQWVAHLVGSSRVDLQACKLEYSIVSPK